VGEAPYAPAGSVTYPVVKVATSADLATWSSPVEVTQAYSQRWPSSVAVGQDPATGTLYALFEQFAAPQDYYIAGRTSATGTTWAAQTLVGYDRSGATNGTQGYTGKLPAWVAGSTVCAASVEVGGGSLLAYGHGEWNTPDAGKALVALDCKTPSETFPMPYGAAAETRPAGAGVNRVSGRFLAGGVDLAVAARAFPLTVARTYNSYDAVVGRTGPFGYGWTWSFGIRAVVHPDGSVTIIDQNGRRSVFWKTGSTWTAAAGIYATLTPATGGGYTLVSHNQTTMSFDASGKLLSATDRNGNTLTLSYSGANLTAIAGAGGRTLTVTTDGQGRITQIQGPTGSASYTYDGSGNLATATDAAGSVTRYTYDTRHQLLTIQDALGRFAVSNTYTTLARVTSQQFHGTQTYTYAYAYQGYAGGYGATPSGQNIFTDPRGVSVHTFFDAGLNMVRQDVMGGTSEGGQGSLLRRFTWTYDADHNILTATDPNGRVISRTFDTRGNLLTVTLDAGAAGLNLTVTSTYNSTNDIQTVTDALGRTTRYTYDGRGNRLTATNPANETTTFGYDGAGQVVSVADPTGRTVAYGYNAAGDRTSVTIGGVSSIAIGYDAAGRAISATDALGRTSTATLDGMGRVRSSTNPLGQTTSYTYDAAGNRTRVTDALGRATTYSYDAFDRMASVTDALAGVTSYAYDAAGNRTATTNARGNTWTATFDGLNRAISERDPLGNTTRYTYDAASNLTRLDKPNGSIGLLYDRIYRLTAVDLNANGSLDIQYAYDAAGRRTAMADETGSTTYTYDSADRLLALTAPYSGTVSYGYDAAGRMTSIRYPSSHQVQYSYDGRGLLSTVTDWRGGVTIYTYDAAGQRIRTTLPNAVAADRTYDAAGRLLTITQTVSGPNGPVPETLTYAYDGVGNIQTVTRSHGGTTPYIWDGNRYVEVTDLNAGPTTYTYDTLDRLTSVRYPNSDTQGYTYDAVGNRLSSTNTSASTNTGTAVTYGYDAADRLTSAFSSASPGGMETNPPLLFGLNTFTYDNAGNRTAENRNGTTRQLSYDGLNRLLSFSDGTSIAFYTYNGDGERVASTVNGATRRFTLGDVGGLSQVLADSTGREYVYGLELIAEYVDGAATPVVRYSAADQIGSPVQAIESNGAPTGLRYYDAFGAVRSQSGELIDRGFTGEQVDAESGFVYLRARYYDPTTGLFLSPDPLPGRASDPTSQHAYLYARNNPLRWTDPTGQNECAMTFGGGMLPTGDGAKCRRGMALAAVLGGGIGSIGLAGLALSNVNWPKWLEPGKIPVIGKSVDLDAGKAPPGTQRLFQPGEMQGPGWNETQNREKINDIIRARLPVRDIGPKNPDGTIKEDINEDGPYKGQKTPLHYERDWLYEAGWRYSVECECWLPPDETPPESEKPDPANPRPTR
jgi:RHS repeat-associated protein